MLSAVATPLPIGPNWSTMVATPVATRGRGLRRVCGCSCPSAKVSNRRFADSPQSAVVEFKRFQGTLAQGALMKLKPAVR